MATTAVAWVAGATVLGTGATYCADRGIRRWRADRAVDDAALRAEVVRGHAVLAAARRDAEAAGVDVGEAERAYDRPLSEAVAEVRAAVDAYRPG